MSDNNIDILKSKIKCIQEKINTLRNVDKKNDTDIEAHFFNNDIEFYEKYPYLIKKLIKGGDLSMLDKFLSSLEKVHNGEQSLASTELKLGEDLAQQYLYPSVKPSE
jgi:hypothetical protein